LAQSRHQNPAVTQDANVVGGDEHLERRTSFSSRKKGSAEAAPELLRSELEPVKRTKVYAEVASQIHRLIADGRIKPGDLLPPERELAEIFGVSRASVRDAIRILEMRGLVAPRQGEGTLVLQDAADAVVSPLADALTESRNLTADLFDMRKIFEPPLARVAALRATPEDIEALEEILERQAARVRAGEVAIAEDTAFHYHVTMISKNQVIPKVMDLVMDLLKESRVRSLDGAVRAEKSLEGHRQILDAIKRRDGEAAAERMREHIEEIEMVCFGTTPGASPSLGNVKSSANNGGGVEWDAPSR
jgi:GntR family transcriptional regulator, transcriptional repressor for pyruvate dehydrogenase complex